MPFGLTQDAPVDLDRLDQGAASLPVPQGLRFGTEFQQPIGALTGWAAHRVGAAIAGTFGPDPVTSDVDNRLLPDVLNDRYGVDGYLRFNQHATAEDAGWLSAQAHERRWRDIVLSRTRPNPLVDFGATLAGSLLDPAGLGVMTVSGGLGDLALGARGTESALEAGQAINGLGKLANVGRVVGQGAIANAPYVGLDMARAQDAGDDYQMGDALRDIAAGAILHTGIHFGLAALGARGAPGEATARPPSEAWVAPGSAPDAVQDLSPLARQGAFVKALDDMADDRAVDVGQYVDRAVNPEGLGALDEVSADPATPSFRPLPDAGFSDTAITPRGAEVPVRYGLVEMGDLVTSHTNDLQPNPAFPPELQPRDRARAGAMARNYQLEQELNPRLLMGDVSAASGAPVISPDGVVESGNGRAIALRRSADTGSAAWPKYQAELKAQGLDTQGMTRPVLVRMRTQAMEGPARAALARDMNADVTERMSAPEQAMADAARLPDQAFDQIPEGRGPTSSPDFARAFLERAAPGQENALVGADGRLSPEGARRIKAAVLARAYGDPSLVAQVFEDEAAPSRQLAEGLAEAAPAWAKMRAAAARGEIPAQLDITLSVRAAMDLVRHAAQEKIGLGELLAERLGQKEIFGGEAVSPATEAILRLAYRDEAFKRPTPPERFAAALKDYARQALAVTPGEDLFGETAGENTSRQILDQLGQRFARGDAGSIDLRAPGKAAEPALGERHGPAEPPVIDLRRPGGERDGAGPGGGGVPRGDGPGAEGAGPGAGGGGKPARLTGERIVAADPELKALAEDTAAFAAAHGVEISDDPKTDPDTLAEAIRAAAFCLAEEGNAL